MSVVSNRRYGAHHRSKPTETCDLSLAADGDAVAQQVSTAQITDGAVINGVAVDGNLASPPGTRPTPQCHGFSRRAHDRVSFAVPDSAQKPCADADWSASDFRGHNNPCRLRAS